MASGDFSFNSSFYFNSQMDDDYTAATGDFIWDSPQPDPQELDQQPGVATEDYAIASSSQGDQRAPRTARKEKASVPHLATAQDQTSAQSSASDSSSHSSSPHSSARRKRKASSSSSPPGLLNAAPAVQEDASFSSSTIKTERMFSDTDDAFAFEDSNFPSMGVDMGNLSLDAMTTPSNLPNFDFAHTGASPEPLGTGLFADQGGNYSPQNFGNLRNAQSANASPQMTVQPSKTFFFGDSREHSPNSAGMMNSQESSPAALFSNNSPLTGSADALTGGFSSGADFGGIPTFDSNTLSFPGGMSSSVTPGLSPTLAQRALQPAWPCRLTVGSTPEKSRVETQIPVKLTLHNAPPGIQKLHLPSHTISKPKFQSKPAFQKAEDTLELSTMLVCASAMQREGVQEQAFHRALHDEVPVKTEPSGSNNHGDENDPSRPLNGGPVTICQGCIIRERKRAARKKTKKQEEEDEWAKDEAKRVIVFNCAEVRDWCVPGTKETPIKDHDEPLSDMFVNAPMRIACYCRHQSEKLGFQVIFTIKTSQGRVLAQAISESIMITDDHKQPVGHGATNSSVGFNAPQFPSNGLFRAGEALGMVANYSQEMPFRPSWSTNDLRLLGNQYLLQRNVPSFQRQASSNVSQQSTATATPRNLSRPASPTDPSGHSTKKRRSGGPGHQRVPSGLTMTRLENVAPGSIANQHSTGPASAGLTSSGFHFTTPSGSGFASPLEHSFQQAPTSTPGQYQSGPPTPLIGTGLQNTPFGSGNIDNDPYQFYSAPTSQHPSRPQSPTPASRLAANTFQNMQIPTQAAVALESLPAGLNLNRPPIIQRLIPNIGSTSGGDEVTILGSGFFQGLEVMFGDIKATNTTFWGDTTLVTRSPPSTHAQSVAVVFEHQHHTAPAALRELQALAPTRVVPFHYSDDERSATVVRVGSFFC